MIYQVSIFHMRRTVAFMCWLSSLLAFPATKIIHVKSFTASVPDTVVQGETFSVSYRLVATHWINAHVTRVGGLTLNDAKSNVLEGKPYQELIVQARYSTSRVGPLTIPPMSAVVNGEEILSESKEVYVAPNPQCGEEMTLAHKWLVDKGVDADSLSLNYTASVGNFFFFSDFYRGCYCLVAKKDTWNKTGDPVWAYSTECAMNEKALTDFIPYFFKYYNGVLEEMKEQGKKADKFSGDMESVSPLLGELSWGQSAPYNVKLPKKGNSHVLVGCVPLSMAMIMKYYGYPQQGKSNIYFTTEGRTFDFDCKELTPKWNQYKDCYPETEEEECGDLSKLLGTLSLMMSPTFENSETGVSLAHVKHVMCNNFGYSSRINHYSRPSNGTGFDLLKKELKSHRPSIIARNTHVFVCDGYESGFFHFNMGWKGHGNGYYRIPSNGIKADTTFFHSIITGIEPQISESKKEVTLVKPGMLSEMLSDKEKEELTSLTITGQLNSSDIRLIRAMAGAKDDELNDGKDMGALMVLDLTNATIVGDKSPFRIRKATSTLKGTRTTTYETHIRGERTQSRSYTDSYKYDFNNMPEEKWEEFMNIFAKLANKKGIRYGRISDTNYKEYSFCIKNTITAEMFADCSSLRKINLPQKLKTICEYAFLDCSSIQKIVIPASVKICEPNIFQNCLSLEKIYVARDPHSMEPKGAATSTIDDIFSSYKFLKNYLFVGTNVSPGIKVERYSPKK